MAHCPLNVALFFEGFQVLFYEIPIIFSRNQVLLLILIIVTTPESAINSNIFSLDRFFCKTGF